MDTRCRLSAWRRVVRLGLLVLAIGGVGLGSFVGWRRAGGNFGTVEPGRIYRSAQLSAESLRQTIRTHGIKTVLNLRGANPEEPWYRDELAATLAEGAIQADVPLASDQWLSREQARALVDVIDGSAYPMLIHCEFGAERTGLVAALITLLRPGSRMEDARGQFSVSHLFLPIQDGRVMIAHLEAYEGWLHEQGLAHTPDHLRRWLATDYRPGQPSREYWPCNPYPLRVVTRRIGRVEQSDVEWSPKRCPKTVATGPTPSRQ